MGHGDAQLLGGDGAGHGRGHIPHHQAQAGGRIQQEALVADHDRRRLLRLGAGAHLQIHVRRRDAELLKKSARQAGVIMLAGVHQAVAQGPARHGPRFQGTDDGRNLHEIGPGAGDDIDEHGVGVPALRGETGS